MIGKEDLLRFATEMDALLPGFRDVGDRDEFVHEILNMEIDACEALLDSMIDATLMVISLNKKRGVEIRENIKMSLYASLMGALHVGMQLEREFGSKTEVGQFSD